MDQYNRVQERKRFTLSVGGEATSNDAVVRIFLFTCLMIIIIIIVIHLSHCL
jgi:hypothetical protein